MKSKPDIKDHRSHIAVLRDAALRAVDPGLAVHRHFSSKDFLEAKDVFVVGAGKAGIAMARAAADILGDRVTSGIVAVPETPGSSPDRIRFIQGGHPIPTEGSLSAGSAVADTLARTTPEDLVVALISGGGSALMELPHDGLSLENLRVTNDILLKSGAAIHEVNTVRKQLSRIKGGGVARLAYPAQLLGLILSDVVGNPLDIIASGPTVPSAATEEDALKVIEQYNLLSMLPQAVLDHLAKKKGLSTKDPVHLKVENRLVATNRLAAEAAAAAAESLGFDAVFIADDWQGEARAVGGKFAELAARSGSGRCLIVGGETTVTVRGTGTGGRNQEAAIGAALAIDGLKNVVVAMFATDGVDGPTDAAGAISTGETIMRARALGLDPHKHLADNDSYSFFKPLEDLIFTGPTGTNVNDLMFGFVY